MNLFNVYPRYDITPVKAMGSYVFDNNGHKYLDFYGGHGVISIGHSHPYYTDAITNQVNQIGFYSNSVNMPIQEELAQKLSKQSGYLDYDLFLCNSGAEANENALKLASFHTGKKKVIAFQKSFHGRMAATLNVTDNPHISAPINQTNFPVSILPLNDQETVSKELNKGDVCAVIIESIQGVGGLDMPSLEFLQFLAKSCKENDTMLIIDEVQSGFGRSGKFFAHQHSDVKADIISMAKGMGNGFPVGGILISTEIKAKPGMLGTTFGGNHLACAAAIAVLDIIESEALINNVNKMSIYIQEGLKSISKSFTIKGKGLMLGIDFEKPIKEIRSKLLFNHQVFTGGSSNPNILRILPPLSINKVEADHFINALKKVLS